MPKLRKFDLWFKYDGEAVLTVSAESLENAIASAKDVKNRDLFKAQPGVDINYDDITFRGALEHD
jgi:hypothetical protein